MTVPVFHDGKIARVVGLANKETDYEEADVLHVGLLMDAVWKGAETKRVEGALRKSEERYALTLAAVDDGLWDWHVPSGVAFFSPSYFAMLGYGNGEFESSYAFWRALVHPGDIDRVQLELRTSIEAERRFAIDLRMRTKAGPMKWVCTRGKAVELDPDGRTVRMVGTLSDVIER
jgi:PAS domain S-box-containing protein